MNSLLPWGRWFDALAPALHGKTLAITGSTGFVGRALVSFLIDLTKARDVSLTLLTGSNTSPLDIGKCERISHQHAQGGSDPFLKLIERSNVSHFIHLATPTTKESGSLEQARVTASTLDILEGLSSLPNLGKNFRLLHASSGAVYGPRLGSKTPLQMNDEFDMSPFNDDVKDHYTLVKRKAEMAVITGTQSGKWLGTNARLFAFMGPGLPLNSHFAIGNFVQDCISKRDIVIKGNPLTVRAYLPSEVMAANLLEATFGEFFPLCHVASDAQQTLQTHAELLASISGTRVSLENPFSPPSYYVGAKDSRLTTSVDVDLKQYLRYWTALAERG